MRFETSETSIRICPGATGRLNVYFPYTPEDVAKIKTVLGRRWNPVEKCWSIPHAEGMVENLLSLFGGEQTKVDPSLLSPKVQCSCQHPVFSQEPSLVVMTQELQLRGYGAKTCKAYLGHVKRFVRFCEKGPEALDETEVQRYVLGLLEDGNAHSTVNQY